MQVYNNYNKDLIPTQFESLTIQRVSQYLIICLTAIF